jgi:tetrahydrodipicolinate N-succinyltransferase
MKYALIIHTGHGFYTHRDREKIPVFRICDNVAILTDNPCAKEWIQRVKGQEITKQKASAELEDRFDKDKTNEIIECQKELADKQSMVFDPLILEKVKRK